MQELLAHGSGFSQSLRPRRVQLLPALEVRVNRSIPAVALLLFLPQATLQKLPKLQVMVLAI